MNTAKLRELLAKATPGPWNSSDVPLEYVTKCADGTEFRNVCQLPAHAIAWRIHPSPELAKARELLRRCRAYVELDDDENARTGSTELLLLRRVDDFLARTK